MIDRKYDEQIYPYENLDQELCDLYLMCPDCRCEESSLKYSKEKIICSHCGFESKVKHGIPCLIRNNEIGIGSSKFFPDVPHANPIMNPFRSWKLSLWRRLVGQEIRHFLNVIYFSFKFGLRKMVKERFCKEVEKALYYGWKNYFNIILKAGEIVQFNKMKNYITEPSLEIGCGGCKTTNMIFRDEIEPITFGCEYFMNGFLTSNGTLDENMFKVIKHYVGGGIRSLPFKKDTFNSIVMVHIIDHIVHTEPFFKEVNRILKPGGYLLMTGYSKNTFENLPGVKLRKLISPAWAERYKEKRIKKDNPRGCPFKSDFEFTAQGQNMYSIKEWEDVSSNYGFNLVDSSFFGKYFSYFMDIEYRGYYNSILCNNFIYAAISEMIEQEKVSPLSEQDSNNVILVLQKKGDI